MPRFLCRLGLHKWRYKDAVITSWTEYKSNVIFTREGFRPIGLLKTPRTQVFSERECQRYGIKQEKRFAENDQGNKTPVSGWEKIT